MEPIRTGARSPRRDRMPLPDGYRSSGLSMRRAAAAGMELNRAGTQSWEPTARGNEVAQRLAAYRWERWTSPCRSVTVIECRGEVDVSSVAPLRQMIQRELALGQALLVVDLSDTSFIDSTALGVLIGSLRRCQRASGDLSIVSPSGRVNQIFAVTRLDQLFSIFPTVADALGAD